jgi:predicted transcriptional regulator
MKTNEEIAKEVIDGKWGNGSERKRNLIASGYDYSAIQKLVNSMVSKGGKSDDKTIDEIAMEVIAGKWGNGSARKNAITNAGYNYSKVQARVNELSKK